MRKLRLRHYITCRGLRSSTTLKPVLHLFYPLHGHCSPRGCSYPKNSKDPFSVLTLLSSVHFCSPSFSGVPSCLWPLLPSLLFVCACSTLFLAISPLTLSWLSDPYWTGYFTDTSSSADPKIIHFLGTPTPHSTPTPLDGPRSSVFQLFRVQDSALPYGMWSAITVHSLPGG